MDKVPQPVEGKGGWKGIKKHFALGGVGWIFIAFVLSVGVSLGVNLGTGGNVPTAVAQLVGLPGTLWLRTLKATVLPLVVSSMILSMFRLRTIPGASSSVAKYTIAYYMVTTLASVIIGMVAVFTILLPNITPITEEELENLMENDKNDSATIVEDAKEEEQTIADQISTIFTNLIPENVVGAMAEGELLAIIVTGITIGLLIPTKNKDSAIIKFAEEIEGIVAKIIRFVIILAPVGVFFLLFGSLVRLDLGETMVKLALNVGTQMAALGFHWAVFYPTFYFLMTRSNPFKKIGGIIPAPLTALGTSSSAATLPVTMQCAKDMLVPKPVREFALPLGMTVNMDGSGIAFQVTSMWMAAAQDIELGIGKIITIAVLATLGAIGTSPIPNSGIALLILVAESVDIPTQGFFALVVASDIVLDRFYTAVNVSGDLWGSLITTHLLSKKPGAVEEFQRLEREEMEERGEGF